MCFQQLTWGLWPCCSSWGGGVSPGQGDAEGGGVWWWVACHDFAPYGDWLAKAGASRHYCAQAVAMASPQGVAPQLAGKTCYRPARRDLSGSGFAQTPFDEV